MFSWNHTVWIQLILLVFSLKFLIVFFSVWKIQIEKKRELNYCSLYQNRSETQIVGLFHFWRWLEKYTLEDIFIKSKFKKEIFSFTTLTFIDVHHCNNHAIEIEKLRKLVTVSLLPTQWTISVYMLYSFINAYY